MIPPPIASDEPRRLQALRALLLLDTAPDERFDRIVRFAAEEFQVPIALVSLVDEHRQWFKSKVGLSVCETARDISFCAHAIAQDAVFIVEDAAADPRFHDNPLVTGEPCIRFYAGAPLILEDGQRIGTLCLIDRKPRRLDSQDVAILGSLRRMVVDALAGQEAAG